ncbi:MAG TPA: hypothetical protein VMM18_15865 [Gemmatimonadaceae bacterium]|nr:hypothetical protein [Gemmatimonadaceae bacterium]
MSDERFDELMAEAAQGYRVPPPPPLEAMWKEIDRASFPRTRRPVAVRGAWWMAAAFGMAATLLIGIAIGRITTPPPSAVPEAAAAYLGEEDNGPYRLATSRYLGEAAALLVALPGESPAGLADSTLIEQAHDLLSTTRILLDSPVADDPRIQMLLRDLELVLAQVSRLSAPRTAPGEMRLITDAIEERDVLPRLRTVVAELPPLIGP